MSPMARYFVSIGSFIAAVVLATIIYNHYSGTTKVVVPPVVVTPALIGCQLVGDSITEGLVPYFKECRPYGKEIKRDWQSESTRVGAGSAEIIGFAKKGFETTILSSGTNDFRNPRLRANLETVRKLVGGKVVWIISQYGQAASIERDVARKYGDRIVTFQGGKGGEMARIHPASYKTLAADIRKVM